MSLRDLTIRARASRLMAVLSASVVGGVLVGTIIAGPAAAASSVTVHVGCTTAANGDVKALVQAIRDANARPSTTTTVIYLNNNNGTGCEYMFVRAHSFPLYGANALPVVRSHIVLHGQNTTLSRQGDARFRLIAVDTTGVLKIDHLIIYNGNARNGRPGASHLGTPGDAGAPGRDGGGIYNMGRLTLSNVTMTSNVAGNGGTGGSSTGFDAADGTGGASGDDAGPTIGGNGGAGGRGGAIYSTGTLTISNSTFGSNRAGNGGAGGDAFAGDGGDGSIGNPGGNGGTGGAATGGNGGPGGYGGAIYSTGPLTISNSTLSQNSTGNGGDGGTATGGRGGDGADLNGTGGDGGSAVTLAASGGTGTAIYQWGSHADILNDTVTNNSGGNGGSSSATGGAGGTGGCDGTGGTGGDAVAGQGNAGTDPLRADNGATLTTTGTSQSGNTTGSSGSSSAHGGSAGSGGPSCT